MEREKGEVIEVFIPKQYRKGILLDVMDRDTIGFKVMTEGGLKEVVLKQNEENAQIMKGDKVVIIKRLSDNEIIDIKICGEDYDR